MSFATSRAHHLFKSFATLRAHRVFARLPLARVRPTAAGLMLMVLLAFSAAATVLGAQQAIDEEYTAKILEFTTEEFFSTPYVDHLPASATVPTPLDILGHIVGAADVLSYAEEIYTYMRAVADASPRVQVHTIGRTEEGREMILVLASSEENLRNLEVHKANTARLGDPRMTSEAEAAVLISSTVPMY